MVSVQFLAVLAIKGCFPWREGVSEWEADSVTGIEGWGGGGGGAW